MSNVNKKNLEKNLQTPSAESRLHLTSAGKSNAERDLFFNFSNIFSLKFWLILDLKILFTIESRQTVACLLAYLRTAAVAVSVIFTFLPLSVRSVCMMAYLLVTRLNLVQL